VEETGKIFIILFAFGGFLLASYIRGKKRAEKPLVCPLEGSCEEVVHSRYSTLFGIPLETWGMLYYGATSIAYAFFLLFPELTPSFAPYALLLTSAFAFLLSMYLTSIQAFFIHHWCTWCLFSAGISTIIFLLGVAILNQNILLSLLK